MTAQGKPPISILVVASDQAVQLFLQKKLKLAEGWSPTVSCAQDSETALQMLQDASFDLVFIDSGKPPLDGQQLLSKLRQLFTKSAVVMVLDSADTSAAVESMKKGALDCLTLEDFKTLEAGRLYARLMEARNLTNSNMELRQINQMKNEFIANISHELRTPLQIIIGFAKALETGSLGKMTDEQAKATRSILDRSESLLLTINQILKTRDSTLQREELVLKPLDLSCWIDGFAKKSHRGMAKKSMRLEATLPSEETWVLANEEKLDEALANLMSNAVKFSPEGGAIHLSLTRVENQAQILLRDEGPGVVPEMLPHLFEQFYIASQGPIRSHPGLGLGLPLAKEIIELHAGRIWIESGGPQRGTTAVVSLPLTAHDAPQRLVGREARAQKKKVLIVEDNQDLVEVLRLFMSSISPNLELSAVNTGFDALKALEEDTPHLVILDVMMPGMDGIEVIRRMNLLPQEKRVPVLVLTGYMEAAQKALKAGAREVLLKPFEKDVFIKKVLRLLS
ncbi:MAG: response regulator [Elusimicrobia bacterium]|nr:response regulator [Elusimicrobiota bacterium]